jgi:hypothetical protein
VFVAAPGSVVVVRDEEWLVTDLERSSDGWFVSVRGLSELVREVEAVFYTAIDDIEVQDPAAARVVADDSPATGVLGCGWKPLCARPAYRWWIRR